MNKFTPGKWDVSVNRKNLVIGPRGHALADCKFSRSTTNRQLPTESECIANARLIAAAPEMYEALCAALPLLEFAVETRGDSDSDYEFPARSALDAVRAAITKATGERS